MRARFLISLMMLVPACHRRASASSGVTLDGAAEKVTAVVSALSAPIVAARGGAGAVLVAGMSATRGAVVVARPEDATQKGWTVDLLTGVSATANVELRAFPSGDGVGVVYRGHKDGRQVTLAATVSAEGKVSNAVAEAGAAACGTDDRLAWISSAKGADRSRVLGAPWSLSPVTELFALPRERDPMLVCGSKTIFVLGDGERDTTLTVLGSGTPRTSVVMRERDFADEEREHDPFVVKDTLGLVRVGQSGSISTREVNEGGSSPWRRLSTKLTEADDVVAVDGTLGSALIVFTRDETSACDGPATPSIHAVFAPVEPDTEGGVERSYDLAVGECDRELGQFWTGAIGPRSFVTAWVERVPSAKPGEARVSGISYRTIADDGVGELRHVARSADEMVDAGCDNRDRCYAVSLSRSDDGSQHIDVLAYP